MATVDELLGFSNDALVDDTLVVDNDLRTITVPKHITHIGVESDKDVLILKFKMPRYFQDKDLSLFKVHVNYKNANKVIDVYEVDDLSVDDEWMYFSWEVGKYALLAKGTVKFSLCLKLKSSSGEVLKEFNTTTAALEVLEGLEANGSIIDIYPDILDIWKQEIIDSLNGNIDPTFSQEGMAADAYYTGLRLNELSEEHKSDISGVKSAIAKETSERKAEIAVERKRIDQLSAIPEGSTTGDVELMNIRIGENGFEYSTAGEAVRHQIGYLHKLAENPSLYDLDIVRKHLGITDLCEVDSLVGEITDATATWKYVYDTTKLPVGEYTIIVREMDVPEGGYLGIQASTTQTVYLRIYEPGVYIMKVYDDGEAYDENAVVLIMQMANDTGVPVGKYYVAGISIYEGDIRFKTILPPELLGLNNKIDKQIGKNLFNKNTVITGAFISGGGVVTENEYSSELYASDYIPVEPNTTYVLTDYNIGGACIALYDETYSFVQAYGGNSMTPSLLDSNGVFTTTANSAFVRISGNIAAIDTNQLEKGNEPTSYEEYIEYAPLGEVKRDVEAIKKRLDIPVYYNPLTVTSDRMVPGDSISVTSPDAKNHKNIGVNAKVKGFNDIIISQGKTNPYCSAYIRIDNTHVYVYEYTTEAILIDKFEHGLAISNFISVSLHIGAGFTADLVMTTTSGVFTKSIPWNGSNGNVMLESSGSTLENVSLSYFIEGLKKDVWIFGDSYLDFWPEKVIEWGYDDFYLDGYSGRNSADAMDSLKQNLEYYIPKKIVWLMGMNDADNGAVNTNWKKAYDELVDICETYHIKLILSTVPNVPERDHTYKNTIVRNSGYRYVDVCKAVGAEESTLWYDGLLGGDNTHPSRDLGATTIADYILSSVPEIANGHICDGNKETSMVSTFYVIDYYATEAELKASVTSPSKGDTYGVGTAIPYEFYTFSESRGWVNNGTMR